MKPYVFKSLLNKCPFAYAHHKILLDEQGKPFDYEYIEINDAFVSLTGLPTENIMGRRVSELLPDVITDESDWVGRFGRVALGGGSQQFAEYSKALNRWYQVTAFSPEHLHFVTIFDDITELVESKNALEASESRYRGLVESNNDLIVRVDTENRLTFVNDTYCKTFGKTRDELLGKPFLPLVREEDRASTLAAMEKLKRFPYRAEMEQQALTVNGWRWLFWEDNAILDENGRISEIQGVGRDITQFKEKEAALEERNQKLQIAQEFARMGYWEYDVKSRRLTWSNACEKIFGLAPNTFEGSFEAFMKRVHPDDRDFVYQKNKAIVETGKGETIDYEHRIIREDGAVCWVRESAGHITDERGESTTMHGFIMDVTHLKKAEEAIETEKKLRQIIDNLDGSFVLLAADAKKILYLSPAHEDIFEQPVEEVMVYPEKFHEVIHTEDVLAVMEDFAKIPENQGYRGEFRILLPDQRVKWIRVRIFPVRNEDGETIRYAGYSLDITRQIRAEEEIRQSNARFQISFQSSPYAMVLSKPSDGTIVEVNKVFMEKTGYSKKELIGKSSLELDLWENPDEREQMFRMLKSGNDVSDLEMTFRTKDGGRGIGAVSARLVQVNSEDLMLASINDITEKREAQQAIAISEARFQQMAEMAQTVIYEVDEAGYYRYVSPAAKKVWGYHSDELIGKMPFWELYPKEVREKYYHEAMALVEKEGKITDYLNPIMRPDGTTVWVKTNGALMKDEDGKIIGFRGSDMNVTEEVKAREQIKENDRLKSAFLATMNHELRTPLNHVIGFSQVIESMVEQEDIRSYAGSIHKSGQQLLAIVEDIFALAMAEQGEIKIRQTIFATTDLLEDSRASLESILEASGKGRDIALQFNPDEQIKSLDIITDRNKINQVLDNLFRNAVKFTDQGYVEFGFHASDNSRLTLYVKDTGIGIIKDKQEVIFDFFRQADESDTRIHDGVGIGLAISKRIVEAMGGSIALDSEPGKGSTFYINIPVVLQERQQQQAPGFHTSINLQGKCILIAEDDEDSRVLLKTLLRKSGATMLEARNGKEALDISKKHPDIDLVLMDLRMPLMDGFSATEAIKAQKLNLPVIALSAYTIVTQTKRMQEAGFDDVLKKPINPELLYFTLQKYLRAQDLA